MNLVTTASAACELGMRPDALRRWAKHHDIKPEIVTVGGHFRWDLDGLKQRFAVIQQSNRP